MKFWLHRAFLIYVGGALALIATFVDIFVNHVAAGLIRNAIGGLMMGMALGEIARHFSEKKLDLELGQLPVDFHVTTREDGPRVAIITRRNGDLISLEIPEDYPPAQDGGEWLLQQILTPEQYAKIQLMGVTESGETP